MKKLILGFLFVCNCMIHVFGQSAGSKMIGGTVGFTSFREEQGTGNEDYKISGIEFSPSFGYFLSDNIALGVNLEYSSYTEDDQGFEIKYTEFSFGPFARLYKFTSNEKFAFFAEGSIAFGSGKIKPEGVDEAKSSSLTFAVSPGFAYFFNEKWVLDLQLQGIVYRSEDPNKDVESDKTSTLIFGASSFNPSLGFRFIF